MTLVANMVSVQSRLHVKPQPNDWYMCKICKFATRDLPSLRQHQDQIHRKPKVLNLQHCEVCGKAFGTKIELEQHVTYDHKIKLLYAAIPPPIAKDTRPEAVVAAYKSEVVRNTPPYLHTSSYQKTLTWINSSDFDRPFYDINSDLLAEYVKKSAKCPAHILKPAGADALSISQSSIQIKKPPRKMVARKTTGGKRPPVKTVQRVAAEKAVRAARTTGILDSRETDVSVMLFRGDYIKCNECQKTFMNSESYKAHGHYITKEELRELEKRVTPVILLDRIDLTRNTKCPRCGERFYDRQATSRHQRECTGERSRTFS